MARLTPLNQLVKDHAYDLGADAFDPTNLPAYAMNSDKVGTVKGALTDDDGKIRYLMVDVGRWMTSKQVVVPVGLARVEDDGVYIDSLTREQVADLAPYTEGQEYTSDTQAADERVLRGTGSAVPPVTGLDFNYRDDDTDTLFRTPQKLQLLEERLQVNKSRVAAGSVEVGKRVETRQEQVNVSLEHEEITIERRAVTEPRLVEGNVTLGAASETIRVDLEAEAAKVSKQAYVTEEVEVGKRTVTEQQTFSETVNREVLDVVKTGEVSVNTGGMNVTTADGRTAVQKVDDAVKDAVDPLDGKIDRH
ncbi:DUF2382 domain-containing protein [Deinococcus sp. QL22]|uniref:PRC and DUF2382 domain-containing protein n=1 Tax=Deinococcus sp. QL22 TaxID=2939437 RepID=UPI0020181C5E|nr:DUF2382 domain-containing protein [Deinococcus sp. QL22]UQN09807.1 DUF2382 domain-containing protein [Deinococcus sp. QL22]